MTRRPKARTTREPAPSFELTIVKRGFNEDDVVDYAIKKIRHAARAAPRSVLYGRLKLSVQAHRSVERPALAEVMLDLDGRPVRAHVAARDLREASDLLEQRLRRKLKDVERRSEFLRHLAAEAERGEWRHGGLARHRPAYFPRPAEEREIVRRKTFSFGSKTSVEAAFEMEMLDHDFHLFLDAEAGGDAVVYRLPDGRFEMMGTRPRNGNVPMSVSPSRNATPVLSLSEAEQRLDQGWEGFVFFIDRTTGRGNVLYHRFDGQYGLVAPAEPLPEP